MCVGGNMNVISSAEPALASKQATFPNTVDRSHGLVEPTFQSHPRVRTPMPKSRAQLRDIDFPVPQSVRARTGLRIVVSKTPRAHAKFATHRKLKHDGPNFFQSRRRRDNIIRSHDDFIAAAVNSSNAMAINED